MTATRVRSTSRENSSSASVQGVGSSAKRLGSVAEASIAKTISICGPRGSDPLIFRPPGPLQML